MTTPFAQGRQKGVILLKLREVIEYASKIKPHSFDEDTLTVWVNECEGHIQTEIIGIAPVDVISYSYENDAETELILTPPHTKLYGYYLVAMIDFAHGEYQKYENTMKMYNACLDEYAKWFIRTHSKELKTVSGYYLSAYGLAVKHGYEGTEEEWLKSLVGPQGEQGIQGVQGPPGRVPSIDAGDNGHIVVDGKIVKVYDDTELRADIQESIDAIHTHDNKSVLDGITEENVSIWNEKVDKVEGKELSTNDFTNEYKEKLDKINEDVSNYDDTELKERIGAVEAHIGDIETALDNIMIIQYELINPVVDSDVSLFEYVTDEETMTTSISLDFENVDCENIEEIVIPYKYINSNNKEFIVTSIAYEGFVMCRKLIRVTMPNSIISIGQSAFQGCNALEYIDIPNSVTSIGAYAFAACNLTSITIPDSVTSIGDGAFSECYSLTSITIPDSVTSIGDGAFTTDINLTIYCKEGSTADTYAQENGFNVEYID